MDSGAGILTRKMQREVAERLRNRRAAAVERLDALDELISEREAEAAGWTSSNGVLSAEEERTHLIEIRQYLMDKYQGKVVVRAVYWTGSRAMGCELNTSDWDFMVVVEHYRQPVVGNVESYVSPTMGLVDLSLCETERWLSLASLATLWVLPYLYLEGDVLFCDDELAKRHRVIKEQDLVLPRLKEAAIENLKSNLGVAWTEWQQGLVRKAKKRVVFVIRHLDYVCQICEHNAVVSYKNAHVNRLRRLWLKRSFGSWETFRESWSPVIEELRERLRKCAASYKVWEQDKSGPLMIVRWLNEHTGGIKAMYRVLAIRGTPFHTDDTWILESTSVSPNSSKVAQWCNLAVVTLTNGGLFELVALGIPSMVRLERPDLTTGPSHRAACEKTEYLPQGLQHRKECRVEEFLAGETVILWHHGQAWIAAPHNEKALSWWLHDDSVSELRTHSTSLCVVLRIVCPKNFVTSPHGINSVYLLTAYDRALNFLEVKDVGSKAFRPKALSWNSPYELWDLWDIASRRGPETFGGFVVSFKSEQDSVFTRVLVENPSVSALRNLRDADFGSHARNANRVGGVIFLTGERRTRSHLTHEEDVMIRRAFCFLPTMIDCGPEHEARTFLLPSELAIAENSQAAALIRQQLEAFRLNLDRAYAPFANLPLTECSASFKTHDLSSFLFLLKRQRFATLHAFMEGWKDRGRLHLVIADYLMDQWRKHGLKEMLK